MKKWMKNEVISLFEWTMDRRTSLVFVFDVRKRKKTLRHRARVAAEFCVWNKHKFFILRLENFIGIMLLLFFANLSLMNSVRTCLSKCLLFVISVNLINSFYAIYGSYKIAIKCLLLSYPTGCCNGTIVVSLMFNW